jgi:lysozyme
MEFSAAGLALLKRSEGFRSHVYVDLTGNRTIGYGHRLLHIQSFPNGIDKAFAEQILAHDVRDAEAYVTRLVKVKLTQGQFDALVDFVFNLGVDRLAHSTALMELNAGHYDAAAEQLLLWDHAGNKEITALKARREAEVMLWKGKAA